MCGNAFDRWRMQLAKGDNSGDDFLKREEKHRKLQEKIAKQEARDKNKKERKEK